MKLNFLDYKITFFLVLNLFFNFSLSQTFDENNLGANRTELYLKDLVNKNVAVVGNHSSLIFNNGKYVHLIDSLLTLNINLIKVFSPEHGFRGEADAGEKIKDNIDNKTGLKIISLYGSNKKPTKNQLDDIDILIFDIQDVGGQIYTYINIALCNGSSS